MQIYTFLVLRRAPLWHLDTSIEHGSQRSDHSIVGITFWHKAPDNVVSSSENKADINVTTVIIIINEQARRRENEQ